LNEYKFWQHYATTSNLNIYEKIFAFETLATFLSPVRHPPFFAIGIHCEYIYDAECSRRIDHIPGYHDNLYGYLFCVVLCIGNKPELEIALIRKHEFEKI
jgi:hypothetical protein